MHYRESSFYISINVFKIWMPYILEGRISVGHRYWQYYYKARNKQQK